MGSRITLLRLASCPLSKDATGGLRGAFVEGRQHLGDAAFKLAELVGRGEAQDGCGAAGVEELADFVDDGGW